jgi:hypothetical protein
VRVFFDDCHERGYARFHWENLQSARWRTTNILMFKGIWQVKLDIFTLQKKVQSEVEAEKLKNEFPSARYVVGSL